MRPARSRYAIGLAAIVLGLQTAAVVPAWAIDAVDERASNEITASSPLHPDFMVLGPTLPSPPGYLTFCASQPNECGVIPSDGLAQDASADTMKRRFLGRYFWQVAFHRAPGSESSAPWPSAGETLATSDTTAFQPLTLTQPLMSTLVHVNAQINQAIRYMSDERQYGSADYWTLPLARPGRAQGDCKAYVLEKHRALVAAGVPVGDLSIAIVRTRWGDTHAVLLVSTDQGELVLDSLSSRIGPWWNSSYTWIERQAPGQQLAWVKILPSGY